MYNIIVRNILLTGHKGLVGSAVNEECQVITSASRITYQPTFSQFMRDNNVDTVIHAAARVGGVKFNFENKIKFYLDNSKVNDIVFESCIENNVKTLINLSSTCVFPDKAIWPLTEDQIHLGPPHWSNDGYAYSKRMMQLLCSYARQEGKNYFTLVPTNVFGPHDNFNLDSGHVLPSLIQKCYLAKKNNEDFVIWGKGVALREFIYSKDLARIIHLLLDVEHEYDSIIVSNSHELSIKYCAEAIARAFNFKGNIIFDSTKPEGQLRKPTNNNRLLELLPDFEFTEFEVALEETIGWFLENYDHIRK